MIRTCLFSGLALAAFASATLAQEPTVQLVDGPVNYAGVYDYATGVITPGAPIDSGADSPGCFNEYTNPVPLGFYGPGVNKEVVDWATFAACGTNVVTKFGIGYATNVVGTINLTIRFYSGTGAACTKGALVQTFALTGLPGSTSATVTLAQKLDIDISATPMVLPVGSIGWSYQPFNAGTGPLLSGAPHMPGNADAFQRWTVSTGVCDGTFSFSCTPMPCTPPFAAFQMRLDTQDPGPTCAGWEQYGVGAGGINLGTLDSPSGTAKIGSSNIIVGGNPQTSSSQTSGQLYGSLGQFSFGVFGGTLLIDPSMIFHTFNKKTFPGLPGSSVTWTQIIPNDVSLIDANVYYQALYICTNPSFDLFRFTNGLKITVCP